MQIYQLTNGIKLRKTSSHSTSLLFNFDQHLPLVVQTDDSKAFFLTVVKWFADDLFLETSLVFFVD